MGVPWRNSEIKKTNTKCFDIYESVLLIISVTEAQVNSLANTSFVSSDGLRGTSVMRSRVTSSVQCVQFEYRIPVDGSSIYAGGVTYNTSTADTINLFENLGAMFTAKNTVGTYTTGKLSIRYILESIL